MNICYLANLRFPSERAQSTQIVAMCQAFAALGHQVDLVVNSRKTHIKEDPEAFYGFPFSFTWRRFWVPDIVVFGRIGFAVALGIFCVRSLFYFLQHKPDVIYSRSEWVLAWLVFWFPRRRFVYESHEAKWSRPVRFLARRKIPFVVISEGIRAVYRDHQLPDGQTLVAHDGIDDSFLGVPVTQAKARTRLGLDTQKPIVMYIGGLDAWKGANTFFAASAHTDEVQFVVIGGKPAVIAQYQTQYQNVTFLGERPYKELFVNQQAADILVVPNTAKNALSARYTSPLKLFAHMASGRPLIVSDIPSLTSVVSDAESYRFKSDDALALAATIDTILTELERAAGKAAAAKELAGQYTWSKRAEAIIHFIT